MKKYPCVETTIEFTNGNMKVRLWIDNPDSLEPEVLYKEFKNMFHDVIKEMRGKSNSMVSTAEAFAELIPGLNAVQFLSVGDSQMHIGHMIYTVPFEDKERT